MFYLSCLFLQKPWALSSYRQLTTATTGLACPWGVAGREGSGGQGKGPCPPLLPWLLQLCFYEIQLYVHNHESMRSPCVWALRRSNRSRWTAVPADCWDPTWIGGRTQILPCMDSASWERGAKGTFNFNTDLKKKKCASIQEHQKWQILKNKLCQQKQRLSFL